jgi:ubiquinone biosynthesis protein
MLKESLVPTPLIERQERKPVVIVDHLGEAETWVSAIRLIVQWLWSSLWARIFHRRSPEESARKVRELMEQMGGLWVKTGQLLFLRSDILSPHSAMNSPNCSTAR